MNHRLQDIFQFLRWLMIFLLILELVIRLFVIQLPCQQYVSYLGYIPIDNSITIWGVEGFGTTHYLSNGEIATPYQGGTSVVVLGDSFTAGWQVNDNEKYVSVAETILHARGVKANLHNLGAAGRNIADYVYAAPLVKKLYSPKIVVIQLTASDFGESFNPSGQNYFISDGSSLRLEHNDHYFKFNLGIQNLLRFSGIGSLLVYKLTPLVKDWRLKLVTGVQEMEKNLLFAKNNKELQNSQPAEVQDINSGLSMKSDQQARDIEASLAILKDAYKDSQIVFLVIPSPPQLQNGDVKWDSDVDNNIVADINNLPNSDVIYPKNNFLSLYTLEHKFPRGFFNSLPNTGHLNTDGNFAVGVALADYLEAIMK